MDGMTPLTSSILDISNGQKGSFTIEDDDGGVTTISALVAIVLVDLMSKLGMICHILPSSQSTSAIEVLASFSSFQHLKAKFKIFTTHSGG